MNASILTAAGATTCDDELNLTAWQGSGRSDDSTGARGGLGDMLADAGEHAHVLLSCSAFLTRLTYAP